MVLVILGAAIFSRNRSSGDDTLLSDRLTETEAEEAAEDDTTDSDDTGSADAADDPPDICELLPQDAASDLAREDLDDPLLAKRRSRCGYPRSGSDLSVTLWGHLGDARSESIEPNDPCPVEIDCALFRESTVPALPDGRVWWYRPARPNPDAQPPPGGWPDWMDEIFVGVRVEWTAAGRVWSLRLRDGEPQTEEVILSRRDDVIAEAERVHQRIMTDPDRWNLE